MANEVHKIQILAHGVLAADRLLADEYAGSKQSAADRAAYRAAYTIATSVAHPVEPAQAQEEREAFGLFPDQLEALAERLKQYREAHKDDRCSPQEVLRQCKAWAGSDQYHGTGTGDSFQRAADLIEALLSTRPAQTEQQPVAWGAFHFGGRRSGKLYAHCETEQQIERYIADLHRSNDSITLRKGPLYAAPIAQTEQPEHGGLEGRVCGGDAGHNTVNIALNDPAPWADLRIGTAVTVAALSTQGARHE